jgi:leader peptidase (prepilin peptidase)/N-methyltransferase
VGPPRHRRDRLLPQGDPVRRPGRDRRLARDARRAGPRGREGLGRFLDPLALGLAVAGLAWGLVTDRIASRWPAHEDGAIRPIDWRTPAVGAFGAAAFWLLGGEASTLAAGTLGLFVIELGALVLLFATDLDQRVLPDVVTYPLAALAVVAFVLGLGPFVRTPEDLAWAAAFAAGIPGLLYLVSIPFGAGAIGRGDLKLLFGFGLLVGPGRLFLGLVAGAILAAAVILVLVVLRRITLRSFVPYGPFLIVGAVWALLAPG